MLSDTWFRLRLSFFEDIFEHDLSDGNRIVVAFSSGVRLVSVRPCTKGKKSLIAQHSIGRF